ncbi:MAG: hypothetical protein V3T30_07625, partial [Thermodesulfobacteriota bacterium]
MENRAKLIVAALILFAALTCTVTEARDRGPVLVGISERISTVKAKYAEKKTELKALQAELARVPGGERTLKKLEEIKNRIFAIRKEMKGLDEDIKDLKLRIKPPVLNLEGAVNKVKTGYAVKNSAGKPVRSIMFTDIPRRIVPGKPFEVAVEVRSFTSADDAKFAYEYDYLKTGLNVGPVKLRLKKLTAECDRSAYGAINARMKFTPTRIVFKEARTEYYYQVKIETKALIEGSETELSEPLFTWYYWIKPSDDDLYDTQAAEEYKKKREIQGSIGAFGNERLIINDNADRADRADFLLRPFKKGERFLPGALPGYEHPGGLGKRPSNCKDRT